MVEWLRPSTTAAAERAGESQAGTVITGPPVDPVDRFRDLPLPAWEPRGDYRDIRMDVAEGIAKLTICRPEVRNAFRPQTLFELSDAFNVARDDPSVGVVVLTGAGSRRILLGRRPEDPGRRRLHRRRRGGPAGDRPAQRARPPDPDPPPAQAGGGHGGRLRHRRGPHPPPGLRPDHRRRQRPVRPDRAEGGQLRRRLRGQPAGPVDRPEAGQGGLVPLPPVRRGHGQVVGTGQRGGAAGRPRGRDRRLVPPDAVAVARWPCAC